jgi:hypothetical protein
MQPLRIRVSRIIDYELIVSLVGIDAETDKPVTLHIDHRPFSFWEAWHEAGLPQPIEYAADRLTLCLEISPADGSNGAELIELDRPASAEASKEEPQPAGEIDR